MEFCQLLLPVVLFPSQPVAVGISRKIPISSRGRKTPWMSPKKLGENHGNLRYLEDHPS